MSNPHPTLSKPCKIGRKHTGADSVRTKGCKEASRVVRERMKAAIIKKHKQQVAKFWNGELDKHPDMAR